MKIRSKNERKNATKAMSALALSAVMVAGGSFSAVFASTASTDTAGKFYTDFNTYAEEQEYANKLNEEITAESLVLLKNESAALPLSSRERNVTVFGIGSIDWQFGGYGSGAGSADVELTINDGLKDAGFNVNPKVEAFYEREVESGENYFHVETMTKFMGETYVNFEAGVEKLASVRDSYKMYDDAAIVVLSRNLGSYVDAAYYNVPGHSDKTEHELTLTDNERALLAEVKANFNKVVYVINSAVPMELGDLEDDPDVDAILWAGFTGSTGARAIGRALNGEVNPSGKTVDIYPADFTKDPTYYNSGDGSQVLDANGNPTGAKNAMLDKDGEKLEMTVFSQTLSMIEYEEGIYVGYKWYETASAENVFKTATLNGSEYYVAADDTLPEDSKWAKADADYYNRSTGVVYPFGYGLSYTTFDWTLKSATVNQDGNTKIEVTVTNTGNVAGKDVVQVYWSQTDWVAGDIEKADANLVEFAKTDELQPKESQTLTIEFATRDMASYDTTQVHADGQTYGAYVLEEGNYEVSLRTDSHTTKVVAAQFEVTADKVYETDGDSGSTVSNLFSNNDQYNTSRLASWMADGKSTLQVLSRGNINGTWPTALTAAEVTFSDAFVSQFGYDTTQITYYSYMDKTTDPWYASSVPTNWKQATAAEVAARTDGKTTTQLSDMAGVDYDSDAWDAFLNQLSWSEMIDIVNPGSFGGGASSAIGRPTVSDADGPIQFASGTFWCSAVNQASTWNLDLIEQHGVLIGNESLFLGVNGWYGPAMNTHRSYFDGRAFEYYSQDGLLSGKMAAAAITGAQSKGCNVFLKHFALNEQSTSRMGLVVWANEQAMREIYLKAFELPVKAGATSLMTSFVQVGAVAAPANYALNVELARNEWGFTGAAVTDMYMAYSCLLPGNKLVRTFNYPLGSYSGATALEGVYDEAKNMVYVGANAEEVSKITKGELTIGTLASPTHWTAVRNTCKSILYISANGNQTGNGYGLADLATGKTINSIAGVEISEDVSLDTDDTGAYNVVYSTSNIIAGLTMDKFGKVTGTPAQSGSFTVTVTADDWVKQTYTVTVNLADAVNTTDTLTGKAGTAFSATFTSIDGLTTDWDEGSVEFSVSGAPAGLTMSAAGVLSGTPTESGSFEITVTVSGTKTTVVAGPSGNTTTVIPVSCETKFTLVIAAGDSVEGPDYVTSDQVQDLIDGALADADSGLTSDQVQEMIDKALAENNNGCGSVANGTMAMAGLIVIAGACVAVGAIRRRKNEEKDQ